MAAALSAAELNDRQVAAEVLILMYLPEGFVQAYEQLCRARRGTALRVVLLAADPQAVKVEVWRADALLLLAAVDRLAQRREPAAQAHESVTGTLAGSYIAGTVYITPSVVVPERGEPR